MTILTDDERRAAIKSVRHGMFTEPVPDEVARAVEAAVLAKLAKQELEGCKVVPVKPTQEMMDAAMAYVYKHGFTRGAGPGAVYAAMLAAAPEAPAQASAGDARDRELAAAYTNAQSQAPRHLGHIHGLRAVAELVILKGSAA